MMKAAWEKMEKRFAAYSLRERALIGGSLVIGVAVLGSTLLVEPEMIRVRVLRQSLVGKEAELAQLRAQSATLQGRLAIDPDAAARKELVELKQRLQGANEALQQANAVMVPPERMNSVLEHLLQKQKGLRVVAMRTLAPVSFLDKPGETPAPQAKETKSASAFDVFRHGIEIKLAGTYSDLYAYVRQLEAEKQKFLWSELRIRVLEYPAAEMTLVLHTLSMEKTWLAL